MQVYNADTVRYIYMQVYNADTVRYIYMQVYIYAGI